MRVVLFKLSIFSILSETWQFNAEICNHRQGGFYEFRQSWYVFIAFIYVLFTNLPKGTWQNRVGKAIMCSELSLNLHAPSILCKITISFPYCFNNFNECIRVRFVNRSDIKSR